MAGYETSDRFGYSLHTSSVIAATGATTLVGAPAAGLAIAIDRTRIAFTVDTSSRAEVWFRPTDSATRIGAMSSNLTLSTGDLSAGYNNMYRPPLILDTATALVFVLTQTAASTPGAVVEVDYRIVTR